MAVIEQAVRNAVQKERKTAPRETRIPHVDVFFLEGRGRGECMRFQMLIEY
jgi:hypothetical protein